jgi:hypothetical protein
MRQLTVSQKKVLNRAFKEYQPTQWEELTTEDIEELEKINDTEILWQETNGYLNGLYWKNEQDKPSWLK